MRRRNEDDEIDEQVEEPLSLDDDDPRRKGRIAYRVLKWVFVAFAGMCWLGGLFMSADVVYAKTDTVFQELAVMVYKIEHRVSGWLHGCLMMLAAVFCQHEEHRRDLK